MDLLILDKNLQVVSIVDTYNSIIWTDRFQEAGDFELCKPINRYDLEYLKNDYYIWRKDSEHTMIIEKISIESDSEEGSKAIITGRSLEAILDRRIVWGLKILSGNFQEGIKTLLDENIISPSKPERQISNFIFEYSDDPKITALQINSQYTGDNLYDVITSLCKERNIGFKISLNSSNQFVFKLYSGTDRSYGQFENPYVIFSPNFDNIMNSTYTEEKTSFKNVTLVGGEGEGKLRTYTAVGNLSGLDRREMFTDARDISSDSDIDITASFSFDQYKNEAYDKTVAEFMSEQYFNSCMVDVSEYAGCTLEMTIPKYSDSYSNPVYSTVFVDSMKRYISTAKVWESNGSSPSSGSLGTYEIILPDNVQYIYTSMFNQKAIDDGIYNGNLDDFSCIVTKMSTYSYIFLLRQKGRDDLIENKELTSFEGQADTETMFKYGVDFFNGDIVQIADEYGHETKARITEIITSENEDGSNTTYPTFEAIEEETEWLPGGYTRINYVESTGTQYVDTGYEPNYLTRIVMDLEVTENASYNVCLFGARTTNNSQASSIGLWFYISSGKVESEYFLYSSSADFNAISKRFSVDMDKNVFVIDKTIILANPGAIGEVPFNLYLFAMNGAGESYAPISAKIYSFQIYEDDSLVKNFIPCINAQGVVGFFDTIGLSFYGNSGTGTFIAGK